jgi:hypothetical protein
VKAKNVRSSGKLSVTKSTPALTQSRPWIRFSYLAGVRCSGPTRTAVFLLFGSSTVGAVLIGHWRGLVLPESPEPTAEDLARYASDGGERDGSGMVARGIGGANVEVGDCCGVSSDSTVWAKRQTAVSQRDIFNGTRGSHHDIVTNDQNIRNRCKAPNTIVVENDVAIFAGQSGQAFR